MAGPFALSLLFKFGSAVGRIASYLFIRERKTAQAQLLFALENDARFRGSCPIERLEQRAKKLSHDVFAHVGRLVAEALVIKHLVRRKPAELHHLQGKTPFRFIHSQVNDPIEKLNSSGEQSLVALSAHLGCFELLAAYYVALGHRVYVIGRIPNYQLLYTLLDALRRGYGVVTLWRNSPRSAAKLLQAIRGGGVIAALVDQDTNLESSFVPFFGVRAAHPHAPIDLAIRYHLPIVSTFIVRGQKLEHQVITEQIEYDPNDPMAREAVLTEFSRRLETLISSYPDQWIWWHRRWRRRDGVDYRRNPNLLPGTADYLSWLTTYHQSNAARKQVG